MKRWTILILLVGLLLSLILWAGKTVNSGKEFTTVEGYTPWPEQVLEYVASFPVRNGDRIKPLSTYAKVTMLKFHGDRSISITDENNEKHRIGPEAFLLDALLRPKLSQKEPIFQVENAEILTSIGMETKKASDHYSYESLEPFRGKLYELAQGLEDLRDEDKELSINQTQLLSFARNIRSYETLISYFNFARAGIVLPVAPGAAEGEKPKFVATSTFMATAGEIRKVIDSYQSNQEELPSHLIPVLQQVLNHANDAKFGPMFINPTGTNREWSTAGDSIMQVFQGADPDPISSIEGVKQLEDFYTAFWKDDNNLVATTKQVSENLNGLLTEQQRIDLGREVAFNKANWFFNAIFFCFTPGMIFIVLSWLNPQSIWGRIMGWLTAAFTTIGLVLTIIGITQRALIMHRPPVGNLYDTIIFIAAGVVFIALITELVTRRKLALGIAPFIGFFLLVLSWIYEMEEAVDNLEPLIAVLRSNYWLTIHVLTITLGYAAGLATWVFGVVYIMVRLLQIDKDDPSLRRLLTRMTYGSVCFCLLLSLIGTVLGGIWANDSWGRFWGWDPKENGALMIVLWTLFILHARLGGILKEWGIHLAAVCTGPVVVFSWWHVNLLGVGLHSYGFSDSKSEAVNLFYTVNLAVLALGFITMVITKKKKVA